MADVPVLNPSAALAGRLLITAEADETITGQKTFSRGANAPFAVVSGAGLVANLDADKLDGGEGSFYRDASNLNAGEVPAARLADPLPAKSGENLTNLDATELTGTVPNGSIPNPLPAVSGANLTALPATLPASSGVNLTALNASNLGSGTVPDARLPAKLLMIQRGGTLVNENGIASAVNVIAWRAPYACTVTNVRGYRVGGTGATINARRNGSSNHLSSALSLTSADTWQDGGSVQNTAYSAGDKLEIMVVSATADPTQISVQVDLTID